MRPCLAEGAFDMGAGGLVGDTQLLRDVDQRAAEPQRIRHAGFLLGQAITCPKTNHGVEPIGRKHPEDHQRRDRRAEIGKRTSQSQRVQIRSERKDRDREPDAGQFDGELGMAPGPSRMPRTGGLDRPCEPGVDLGQAERYDIAGTHIDQHAAADQRLGRRICRDEFAFGIHDQGGIEQVLHETITGN